jgi:hypothetical protein
MIERGIAVPRRHPHQPNDEGLAMNGLDPASYELACNILTRTNEMTLATLRADGSPHASTVSFASDGLILFAAIAIDCGKAYEIRRDGRVSLTVNAPFQTWNQIQGLSIDGVAALIDWPRGQEEASALLLRKLPAYAALVGKAPATPWPGMLFIRIVPKVVNVLDYTERFGHSTRFAVTDLA